MTPRQTDKVRQTRYENPTSFQEFVEGKLVGRTVLYDTDIDPKDTLEMQRIGEFIKSDPRYSGTLSFGLHHNSPQTLPRQIKMRRPVSAYFTYDPKRDLVIVEWGEIDGVGDAKLHTYLNQVIDYGERHREGMMVRSGHMARLKDSTLSYALLDSIAAKGNETHVIVPKTSDVYNLVRILDRNKHVVISTDGFAVNLE